MPSPPDRIDELRLGDLATFLAVRRAGTVTGAARELRVTPSQVSKAVSRLEVALHVRLLQRSARGVTLSEAGRKLLPQVEEIVARVHAIHTVEPAPAAELTVAGPTYLLLMLLPRIAHGLPKARVRGVELPPVLVRALAGDGLFDLALLPGGSERLPSTWSAVFVGQIRKGLFATPALAKRLGPQPLAPQRVKSVPFVTPIQRADGKLAPVDDDCPLPTSERAQGHEAQSIGLALELAAESDQLVFGPRLAARAYLESGQLVEVRVRGWDVRESLFVACNGDQVLSRVQSTIVKLARAALEELDPA